MGLCRGAFMTYAPGMSTTRGAGWKRLFGFGRLVLSCLQDQLYKEMRGRIQEADQSAPVRCQGRGHTGLGSCSGMLRAACATRGRTRLTRATSRTAPRPSGFRVTFTTPARWRGLSTRSTAAAHYRPTRRRPPRPTRWTSRSLVRWPPASLALCRTVGEVCSRTVLALASRRLQAQGEETQPRLQPPAHPPTSTPCTPSPHPCTLPAEEVLLDENEEAKRYSFYMVAGFEESPDHK